MSYPHLSTECNEHHDTVVDYGGTKPPITVLCGSTRFYETFRQQNLRLTLGGHIVLSIGCDTKSDDDLRAELLHPDDEDLDRVKAALDELHKRKIDLADEVLILNVDGYIGESTRSEIEYATKIGKPVWYLEHPAGAAEGA